MKNRSGSYKSVQFDLETLEKSRFQIEGHVGELLKKYHAGEINDQDFTTIYLLLFLRIKHPKNYLQRFSKNSYEGQGKSLIELFPHNVELTAEEKIKLQYVDGKSLFENFNLKSIPKSINRAMINWYDNKWNIILSFKIPSAKNLLKLQSENKRVLTLIVDNQRLTTHVLGKRDPLSFALHDLMHADQFFNNAISLPGQLGFYKFIYKNLNQVEISNLIDSNEQFKNEFEYVVSDMNAYIIHLLKSFKSCFTRADQETLLKNFLLNAQLPNQIIQSILNLNIEPLIETEELKLKEYFENYSLETL